MGYRTCYYRCFVCGKPNKYQADAYEKASKWLSDALDALQKNQEIIEKRNQSSMSGVAD